MKSFLSALDPIASWLSKSSERETTQRVLEELSPRLERIVFVCKGNICRSPYAEHRLRALLSPAASTRLLLSSVGIDTTPGRSADPNALRIAAERGIDLSAHRTKRVSESEFTPSSLAVLMERRQRSAVLELLPNFQAKIIVLGSLDVGYSSDIKDPYGLSDSHFHRSFDRIDQALNELVRLIRVT